MHIRVRGNDTHKFVCNRGLFLLGSGPRVILYKRKRVSGTTAEKPCSEFNSESEIAIKELTIATLGRTIDQIPILPEELMQ